MTPFDVLKTRLQTVQPDPFKTAPPTAPSAECCQTSLLTPRRAPPGKKNPFTCLTSVDEYPAARISRGTRAAFSSLTVPALPAPAPTGCSFPTKWAGIWGEAVTLEEALKRIKSGGNIYSTLVLPRDKAGFWSEIAAIRSDVGIRGLWKGVGTTLTMSVPSSAIYMIGYEHLLSRLSPLFTDDANAHVSALHRTGTAQLTPAPLVAGSLARTISATVISPIEMFRTRLQALPANGISPTYASTFADMGAMVESKGLTVLWRGLGPTLWRDVPFSGIYWAGFELLKSNMSPDMSPLAASFVSGAISGTFSALVTQPFDVLKTRRQVFTPSPDCAPAALKHRASTLPLALHVIRTEGWSALFAGTVPRCGKVAPACGLMIACYEGVGRYLSR